VNLLFVSQCSGKALTESRRILDQFAERRGERTWQISMTKEGLDTLRRLLSRTARKNTAVACHWIRGIDHSELLWIVGDRGQFNMVGATPTDSTSRDILRSHDENTWYSLQVISLLTSMAALLHDLGKSSEAFQNLLRETQSPQGNIYRHEWVSLRLFQAYIGDDNDHDWLSRLADPEERCQELFNRLQKDGQEETAPPFQRLPPLAKILAWLIVSHHRLPVYPDDEFRSEIFQSVPENIVATWNNDTEDKNSVEYWTFPKGTPFDRPDWRKRISKLAERLLSRLPMIDPKSMIEDPFIMHLSRLCLMLADHDYSGRISLEDRLHLKNQWGVFANTNHKTRKLNQPLDEHLLGVESLVGKIVRALPIVSTDLPRLSRHKGLRQRSSNEQFRWQDQAADYAEGIRHRSAVQGAFIINMASTGCGKTLANARMMYALNDPNQGMRCSFALGLRTLTRQTGMEYRERLRLGEDEVAIRVGGAATMELLDLYSRKAEMAGSGSASPLVEEDSYVLYEGNMEANPILDHTLDDPRAKKLLVSPLLVCTIDHLVPATEGTRGGRQIVPTLRLLSGDLVLDELDDYDVDDLPAIARLVHWAGLLGARVLISSATLPPSLVLGMFQAYREGRRHFQKNRGESPEVIPNICCLWVDEFGVKEKDCGDYNDFASNHRDFSEKRRTKLSLQPTLRRGVLVDIPAPNPKENVREIFAEKVLFSALQLHDSHHEIDPKTKKKVSFGLVRMANINPLVDVALALFKKGVPDGYRVHLCVYHSQFPLLSRSSIEQRLDRVLRRKDPGQVFHDPDVRCYLDGFSEENHLFVVLGSPVTEVGRDHDYDWAVVEPSSMRSLIQLAGRVLRHRKKEVNSPNMAIFEKNINALEGKSPAYSRPGFEGADFLLESHSLKKILLETEWKILDSTSRIVERSDLHGEKSLVDLEHARLRMRMIPLVDPEPNAVGQGGRKRGSEKEKKGPGPGAFSWWAYPRAMLTGILQKEQMFREDGRKYCDLVLLPDEDGNHECLHEIREKQGQIVRVPVDRLKKRPIPDEKLTGARIGIWGEFNYMTLLHRLADEIQMDLVDCAFRFGTIRLPDRKDGWRFHPALGFSSADGETACPAVESKNKNINF
jgi:CRISPR-associated endonuclease/helicase Cas3